MNPFERGRLRPSHAGTCSVLGRFADVCSLPLGRAPGSPAFSAALLECVSRLRCGFRRDPHGVVEGVYDGRPGGAVVTHSAESFFTSPATSRQNLNTILNLVNTSTRTRTFGLGTNFADAALSQQAQNATKSLAAKFACRVPFFRYGAVLSARYKGEWLPANVSVQQSCGR